MILQAFVWHVLINEQSLNPSFAINSTISYELDQIRVFHYTKKLNLCKPLFVTLKAILVKLLDSNRYRLTFPINRRNSPLINTAKSAFTNLKQPIEIIRSNSKL
uniref:Uncharacterized protein n=1 Tax=Opuntia streptacantha TaxID=393608 RepID=A0A7C9E7Y8_OPUST